MMKVSFLFPLFLAATQFVAAELAVTPASGDTALIARHDRNGDGKLDEAEVAAVKERMYAAEEERRAERRERVRDRLGDLRKQFDTDGDGKLDETERVAFEKALRARVEQMPRLRERLDMDGDGKISDAEWSAGRERLLARVSEQTERK